MAARHAPETSPTYLQPITEIRTSYPYHLKELKSLNLFSPQQRFRQSVIPEGYASSLTGFRARAGTRNFAEARLSCASVIPAGQEAASAADCGKCATRRGRLRHECRCS